MMPVVSSPFGLLKLVAEATEGGREELLDLMRSRTRALLLAFSVAAVVAIGPAAMADPGLAVGEPNCLGLRNAHSNDPHGHHQMTPKERAVQLEANIGFFYTISPPEFQEWLEGFFGEDLKVSVGEKNRWTQAACAGEIPFPEE